MDFTLYEIVQKSYTLACKHPKGEKVYKTLRGGRGNGRRWERGEIRQTFDM